MMTGFMGYHALQTKLAYDFAHIIPDDHPKYQDYLTYVGQFGEDGNIMVLGVQSTDIFILPFFQDWYGLGNDIKAIQGIDEVFSIPHSFRIEKDEAERRFVLRPFVQDMPRTQSELDSLQGIFLEMPFYSGLVHNPEKHSTLMAITFNKEQLDSKDRLEIVDDILELAAGFEEKHDTEVHYSGLPFIRSYNMTTISSELTKFLIFAMIILAIILYILFRNVMAVVFPLMVVIIGAIWSLGTISLFGFEITILTGLIPTLIVVIGIPNCVYMLNKYHAEYKKHGNKQKALMRMIAKIGHVTFFTNLTTAIGFGVFFFMDTAILSEFGLVAFFNIVATFIISIIAIPIVFSFLPEPKLKHTVHLESRFFNFLLNQFEHWSKNFRVIIFSLAAVILGVAIFGMFQLKTSGFILDDVPQESKIYKDLQFFEQNFDGIMPFEIIIASNRAKGATELAFLQKISQAEDILGQYGEFAKPLSISNAFKFAHHAYHNYNPGFYRLPSSLELNNNPDLIAYLNRTNLDEGIGISNNFLADSQRTARISVQMADIGSDSMPKVMAELRPKFDSIFPAPEYDVTFTGTSVVALEGFSFLIDGLVYSVILAFLLIALIMGYLFRSFRMLFLALIPNVFPLIVTAGIMGYFNIALKPSTVLIFSVAFGISVDYTIHFLAKYRQELLRHSWNISKTVVVSLRETGISMIYTSLILFFGFIVFTFSEFQGTVNLGRLASVTLVVAMLANLVILPALLISFEKVVNRKAIKKEPLLEVYDEETDIDFDKLDFDHDRKEE